MKSWKAIAGHSEGTGVTWGQKEDGVFPLWISAQDLSECRFNTRENWRKEGEGRNLCAYLEGHLPLRILTWIWLPRSETIPDETKGKEPKPLSP